MWYNIKYIKAIRYIRRQTFARPISVSRRLHCAQKQIQRALRIVLHCLLYHKNKEIATTRQTNIMSKKDNQPIAENSKQTKVDRHCKAKTSRHCRAKTHCRRTKETCKTTATSTKGGKTRPCGSTRGIACQATCCNCEHAKGQQKMVQAGQRCVDVPPCRSRRKHKRISLVGVAARSRRSCGIAVFRQRHCATFPHHLR